MARRTCQVCIHPECAEIDRLLITNEESPGAIGRRFGWSRSSVIWHRDHHLARALAAATGAVVTRVDPDPIALVHQVADLERRTRGLLDKAEHEDGDIKTSLRAIAELRNLTELLAKLAGEVSGQGISRAEVRRIGQEMARVVEAVVRDPEQLERIRDGWSRIRF